MKHTLVAAAVLLLGLTSEVPANGAAGHGGAGFGGFSGGGHMEMGHSSQPRDFGGGRFDGRSRDRRHHGSDVLIFPYPYDPYFEGEPYDPDDAYCDEYSPYYHPQYCYYDGR